MVVKGKSLWTSDQKLHSYTASSRISISVYSAENKKRLDSGSGKLYTKRDGTEDDSGEEGAAQRRLSDISLSCDLMFTWNKSTTSIVRLISGQSLCSILMIPLPRFIEAAGSACCELRAGVALLGLLSSAIALRISIQSWEYTGVSSPQMLPHGCLCAWAVREALSSSPPEVCVFVCGLCRLVLSASQGSSPATPRSPSVRAGGTASPI